MGKDKDNNRESCNIDVVSKSLIISKIKLPRKRKKAYLKTNSRLDYIEDTLIAKVLRKDGRLHANRYYEHVNVRRSEIHPNGLKIVKRW